MQEICVYRAQEALLKAGTTAMHDALRLLVVVVVAAAALVVVVILVVAMVVVVMVMVWVWVLRASRAQLIKRAHSLARSGMPRFRAV